MSKPFDGKWDRGPKVPNEGLQSHTFLARRAGSQGEYDHVLKQFTRKRPDPKYRRRVFREMQSMQILDHPHIAKYADSNADQWTGDDELYLVTRKVNGVDLEAFCQRSRPDFATATQIMLKVLDAIHYSHTLDVVHRDIKPCHVILENGDPSKPVIIDFGLAFIKGVEPTNADTATTEAVGNRFIILPEQLSHSDVDKRNFRSDVTQCVGVYFYLLTGQNPGLIFDGRLKSHQRMPLESHGQGLTPRELATARRVFDVGLEMSPQDRWPSAEALGEVLSQSLAPQSNEIDLADVLHQINLQVAASPVQRALKRLRQIEVGISAAIRRDIERLAKGLPHHLQIHDGGSSLSEQDLTFHIGFTAINSQSGSHESPSLRLAATSSELIISLNNRGSSWGFGGGGSFSPFASGNDDPWDEILRMQLADPECVSTAIRQFKKILSETMLRVANDRPIE